MENEENDISLSLLSQNYQILKPKILVFGVGGAGTNAVNNMISADFEGVEFIVANTDAQSLCTSKAKNKIQLGPETTKGLGAGMIPEVGREATEEVADEIARYLEGANMIFITAGMGGGTGTGAAPVIAKMAKEREILTVAVVTKPFDHENIQRMNIANDGIKELKKYVDTLIIVPNQNLYKIANETTTLKESFEMVDDVLKLGVKGITDLITQSGLVNLDFADIRTVMKKMGKSMMGMGEASGKDRAIKAAEAAITNPLLDNGSIKGAKGIVVNITASPNFTLFEYEEATKRIKDEADPNATIIIGNALNEEMGDSVRISVFATGIDDDEEEAIGYVEKQQDYENMTNYKTNNNFVGDLYSEEYHKEFTQQTQNNVVNSDDKSCINYNYEVNNRETLNRNAGVTSVNNNIKQNPNNFYRNENTYETESKYFYDTASTIKDEENSVPKFKEVRAQSVNQYLNEKDFESDSNNSGLKKFLGLFGSKGQPKKDEIKIKRDDDFDIDINLYNKAPTYLRNLKNNNK